ncbi:hypothetical protein ACU6U9_09055 [Pseudomonas sp. HK3]
MMINKIVALPILMAAMSLVGCNDSKSGGSSEKSKSETTASGRLLVSSADSAELAVVDLKKGAELDRISLNNIASSLYSSPKYRFGLVAEREQNIVQIVDGGVYQEDHGDHLHDYKKDASLLSKTFNGVKPTHIRNNDGQVAIFFDGDSKTSLMSSVISFDGDGILTNNERSLNLDNYMHGTAEPRGNFLITTYRPAELKSTLPNQVELYEFNESSSNYDFVERFDLNCPALHGSFSTHNASVFGCSDGVLIIKQDGTSFSAHKIENPTTMPEGDRIGSFSGDAKANVIAGWANGKLYALDINESKITAVDWTNGDNSEYLSSKVESDALIVLDKSGFVHVLNIADNFSRLNKVKALNKLPELTGHSRIAFITNPVSDDIYIVDSIDKKIVVIDSSSGVLKDAITLDFTPKYLSWVGVVSEE